jgi:hypothetical protein
MRIPISLLLTILCLALITPCCATTFSTGPINGTTAAYFIDGPSTGPFSQTISDGFVIPISISVTSIEFGEWVPTGTTPTIISWTIGTSAFASDISSGTGLPSFASVCTNGTAINGGVCGANKGYDVYDVNVGASGVLVLGGTYFLTLGGANDTSFTQLDAWDVNGGAAVCFFAISGSNQGLCGAATNHPGIQPDVEGESFTIIGNSLTTPEPGSLMLLSSGILWLAGARHRTKAKSA